jgi:nitrite reductase/ring-hydroxylating ferredoxin subunit
MSSTESLSRRSVLAGACVTCAAAVAGCATYGPPAPAPAPAPAPGAPAGALADTASIPVGGGVVAGNMVITQPAAGEFKAFSSVCTHQGCSVNEVADGIIRCPCHGSAFSAEDGSVTTGPATEPLAEMPVKVEGTAVLPA